jgi:uncharacterized membrane protein YhaH (DUF805 family)
MFDFFVCYGRIGRIRFLVYFAIIFVFLLGGLALFMHLFPVQLPIDVMRHKPDPEPHPFLRNFIFMAVIWASLYLFFCDVR